MNRTQIAPGAFITEIEGDKFKRCKISIHLILPSQRDTATALALLPHVLDRRCEMIPDPVQLSRHLFDLYGAELGSESYTMGANRVVTFSVGGLKNKFALAGENLAEEYTKLACQLLFAPKMTNGLLEEEDIAIEKEKQADFLRSEMNDKRGYCLRQARRKVFGDAPLGIESAGYLDDIDTITPSSLYSVYQDLLRRAQIEVVVCGEDSKPVAAMVQQYIASIQRKPEAIAAIEAIAKQEEFRFFSEPMESVQGKLCLVYTCGVAATPRFDMVMRVASALLGGLPTSRLFTNVREKESLCYYCTSSYNGFVGTLTMDSGIDHKNAKLASEAMKRELKELQKNPVTEEEMENALLALKGSYTSAKDSLDALSSWLLVELLRGNNRTLDQAAEMLQSITREEVQTALASFVPSVEYVLTEKEGA